MPTGNALLEAFMQSGGSLFPGQIAGEAVGGAITAGVKGFQGARDRTLQREAVQSQIGYREQLIEESRARTAQIGVPSFIDKANVLGQLGKIVQPQHMLGPIKSLLASHNVPFANTITAEMIVKDGELLHDVMLNITSQLELVKNTVDPVTGQLVPPNLTNPILQGMHFRAMKKLTEAASFKNASAEDIKAAQVLITSTFDSLADLQDSKSGIGSPAKLAAALIHDISAGLGESPEEELKRVVQYQKDIREGQEPDVDILRRLKSSVEMYKTLQPLLPKGVTLSSILVKGAGATFAIKEEKISAEGEKTLASTATGLSLIRLIRGLLITAQKEHRFIPPIGPGAGRVKGIQAFFGGIGQAAVEAPLKVALGNFAVFLIKANEPGIITDEDYRRGVEWAPKLTDTFSQFNTKLNFVETLFRIRRQQASKFGLRWYRNPELVEKESLSLDPYVTTGYEAYYDPEENAMLLRRTLEGIVGGAGGPEKMLSDRVLGIWDKFGLRDPSKPLESPRRAR